MNANFSRFNFRFVFALTIIFALSGIALKYSSTVSSHAGEGQSITIKGESSSVKAAGIGNHKFKLQDGYDLPTTYPSGDVITQQSRPLGLVSEDFDIDGYPDLVSTYANAEGGYVAWHKGNPEAFAPTKPEIIEGIKQGEFPTGFLADAKIIELSVAPDFVVAGDFNRDSDPDILIAPHGGQEMFLIAGDGKGNFSKPQQIPIRGRITALTAGQIDLPDNLTDLVVGIENNDASSLLVYQGVERGVFDEPIVYSLPASAAELTLGQLDDSLMKDLAILVGGEIFILHGRNQREPKVMDDTPRLERIALPFSVKAFALGEFIWDRDGRTEMALLADDGTIRIAKQGTLDTRPFTVAEVSAKRRQAAEERAKNIPTPAKEWSGKSLTWETAESFIGLSDMSDFVSGKAVLMNAHLSGQMADDLIVVDSAARQVKVLTVDAPEKVNGEFISFGGPREIFTLDVASAPIAALSMRLHVHIRPGIVILREGQKIPTTVVPLPEATFTVTKQTDTNDGVCNADCSLREAVVAANGAAGADMITVPTGTHNLTIANSGGTNEDGGATGDLDITQDVTVMGNGSANTIIQAGTTTANGIDKVFGFNPICISSVGSSVNGVTIQFGRNTQPAGAPDFSFTGGGADFCNTGAGNASITNSVIQNNRATTGYGGGINIDSVAPANGTVTITGATFNGNATTSTTAQATGGGINMFADQHNVTMTNCTVSNNTAGTTGTLVEGGGIYIRHTNGGAIMIHGTNVSGNTSASRGGGIAIVPQSGTQAVTIDQDSVISGNTSQGAGTGVSEGGGIYNSIIGSSTTNITEVTVSNNALSNVSANQRGGGGIAQGTGPITVSFSRFANNATNAGGGTGFRKDLNAGAATITNNWWGCNTGPSAAPCQTAVLAAGSGSMNFNPWIILRHSASPTTIVTGQASTLTADFLQNSAGGSIAVADLDALIGTSISFGSAVRGNLSAAQTTIQSNGTATATFTATSAGAGSAGATVDNQTTTANVTINQASTTTQILSDSPDPSTQGQLVTVTYQVNVTSPGGGTPTGNVQVTDGVDSCTGTVAAGQCQVALNTLGARTLTATYQGDANYNASPPSAGAGHQVNAGTPTLGNYANTNVSLSGNATVTPDAAPTNTVRMTVSSSADFKGTLEADPTTGVVRVTNAFVAGVYPVVVSGFGASGPPVMRMFNLTVTTPMGCMTVGFNQPMGSPFGVGTNPRGIARADVNNDNRDDLIVANYGSNNVSVMLGNGMGGFSAATNFAVGMVPFTPVVADFNNDSNPDIAVTNMLSANVSILLGDGMGGFGSATNFATGVYPLSVTVGNFNGDSFPDLVTANYGTNNLTVLLGNGTGGFSSITNFASGGMSPSSAAIGDFNNDTRADIITTNYNSNNVSVLPGDGLGGFGAASNFGAGTNPFAITIGEFNNDSNRDIAVANDMSNNVSVLFGNGSGGFGAATNYATGMRTSSVVVGDFNGDGKPDLAAANYNSNNVSFLLGNGTGTFASAINVAAGTNTHSLVAGDFNRDNKADLAATNYSSNNVTVFLNSGVASYGPASTTAVGTNPFASAFGDFNKDGNQDVAVANDMSNNVSVMLGNGAGGLGAATNFAVGTRSSSVAVGDFNGDGNQDLVTANYGSNNVSLLTGNGAGGFAAAVNFAAGTNAHTVAVGDFNADKRPDVAVTNFGSNNVSILLGDGAGGFSAATNFGVGTNPRGIAVGNFNNDTNLDLIAVNYGSNNVSLLLGNGTGGFSAATNFGVGMLPFAVATGDFNNDTRSDIAVTNMLSANVSILLGDGLGSFGTATNFGTGVYPLSVAVGDFNSDGRLDLVTANYGSNDLSMLLGNGQGQFGMAMSLAAGGTSPSSVVVGDLNNDNRQDLISTNYNSNNISTRLRVCPP
jgi:CSLREA domain-containing protein